MGWPEYTYLALSLFGLGVCAAKHGEARPPFSFPTTLTTFVIVIFLLYMGGFFS